MKIKAEYKGKTVEIDIPDEKLEELVKEQKKTGWEKPELRQDYWSVGTIMPFNNTWTNSSVDYDRYNDGNCFTSEELAKNIARYQSLDLRIRRRIAEICEPVTTRAAYVICYSNHGIEVTTMMRNYGSWRFDTEEHAEQIINEFREELMWYFTEFKDRMDG